MFGQPLFNQNNSNQNYVKPVVLQQQLQTNDERDLEEISIKHERLIQTILNEEENLINNHRKHIDDTVELTKKVLYTVIV